MRILKVLLNSVSFTIGWTTAAHADPITAAIFGTAFASTFFGAVVSTGISIAVSYGLSLLASALASPAQTNPTTIPGTQLSLQIGGNVPVSFLLGRSATAGSLIYPGTWGNSGQTPNAYMTRAICICDMTCALTGMWVNDQKITLPTMTGAPPTSQGWPVTEFNVSGVDYLWVRFLDGTQTAADSFLTGTFGTHSTRPFTSDMIGRGQAIVIVTALYNRDLFAAEPTYFFESSGAPVYNPALDTSVGGSGSQRWATPSTWAPSDNPVVQIYNLRRGIFYNGASTLWLYGGNNQVALDPSRLPVANWIAGINACDALVTNADSSTEKSFRAGGEITGDMQPVDVIDTLLQSCNGRMAEVGGIYKIQVGLPGSAVYSFTDSDILITEGQTFDPFPGLEATNNAIEATYPEPIEKWGTKDAPGLYSSTLEAADGGRRLVASVQFPMVPYPLQVQRLCKALILDSRRFRNHQVTLPPDAWVLEPGVDMVSWTSTANGYSSKNFLVTAITGKRGYNQVVSLKEVSPSDYSWNAGTDQQATTTGTLSTIRPPAQVMSGWTAVPAIFYDTAGNARRPSIQIGYDGGQTDVRDVHVVVRLKSTAAIVFDGYVPYVSPFSVVLNGTFLPNTLYQAQGDYVPYSGRQHTASSWLDVTTPNVSLDFLDMSQSIRQFNAFMGAGLREFLNAIEEFETGTAAQDFANFSDIQTITKQLNSVTGDITASYQSAILVATGPSSALATQITSLFVAMGGDTAAVNVRYAAGYTPAAGFTARAGLEARVNSAGTFHAAGIYFDTTATSAQTVIEGDQVVIGKADGTTYALFNSTGEVINGTLRGPGTTNFWNLTTGAFRVST